MTQSNLYVECHGPATTPAFVLVHGAPDRSTSFRDVIRYHADHRVVTYDRRGYGKSLDVPPARAMIDHARDLLTIVENCETPPVVVAHSFGSHPTMLAATLRPSAFGAIGLWEPPLPWVEWWPEDVRAYNARVANSEEPERDIEAIFRSLLSDAWVSLPAEVQDLRCAEGPAFQVDMASELEAPFEFRDVGVPALVGYGTATSAAHLKGASLAGRAPSGGTPP